VQFHATILCTEPCNFMQPFFVQNCAVSCNLFLEDMNFNNKLSYDTKMLFTSLTAFIVINFIRITRYKVRTLVLKLSYISLDLSCFWLCIFCSLIRATSLMSLFRPSLMSLIFVNFVLTLFLSPYGVWGGVVVKTLSY
jgi:hypothetical protein